MDARATKLLQAAHQALRNDRLSEADDLARQTLAIAADDANALLIRGVVAYKQRRLDDALQWLTRSAAVTPPPLRHQAAFWQGNVERARRNLSTAAEHYRIVLALRPDHVDARLNLADSLKDAGRPAEAAIEFLRVGRDHPNLLEAAQSVVDCATNLAASNADPPIAKTLPPLLEIPLISFVVCSITPARLAALRSNLHQVLGDQPWELVHIDDARSLCDGYTRGMHLARGDLLIFCHDDIEVLCADFHSRLLNACASADIVGVAGTTLINGPAVSWAGSPHVHARITHVDPDRGELRPSISSLAPARVDGAQALDGVFIAAWRQAAEQIGFDRDTFDGFHFYDLDFSYRAWRAGLKTRIQSDILLSHHSRGAFNDDYWRYAQRFQAKFPDLPFTAKNPSSAFFETRLVDLEQARRFYRWLAHWLD